jgi:cupin fold WbuC family metalloprotein
MEKFYSKIKPDTLLHLIHRVGDFTKGRFNVIDDDQFIQCAVLNLDEAATFKPHKHLTRRVVRDSYIAQESWVVVKGSVMCVLYDLDDTIIAAPTLNAGDASFTLLGGHTYVILEDDTMVYEMKTGPYEGQEKDKMFI